MYSIHAHFLLIPSHKSHGGNWWPRHLIDSVPGWSERGTALGWQKLLVNFPADPTANLWTLPVKRILYRMLDIAMLYCWRGIFDPVVEVILTNQRCEWTLNMTKWYQICATFRLALRFRVILTSFCTICNMYIDISTYIYIIRSIKFTSFPASVHGAYSFIAHLHSDSSPVLVIGLLEFFLTTPL